MKAYIKTEMVGRSFKKGISFQSKRAGRSFGNVVSSLSGESAGPYERDIIYKLTVSADSLAKANLTKGRGPAEPLAKSYLPKM